MPITVMVSSMIRFAGFLTTFLCLWPAWAQSTQGQITISTQPPVAQFYVDGKLYTGLATFLWPAGSKHILQFKTDSVAAGGSSATVQTSSDGTTQYGFAGWVDNAHLLQEGSSLIQTITADPRITSITTTLAIAYRVSLQYFDGSGYGANPPTCASPGPLPPGVLRPGVVVINATCYWTSAVLYLPAGSLTLNAIPFPGFVFLGWSVNLGAPNSSLRTYTLTGPIIIAPEFEQGKRVNFLSNPVGLEVLVDRTPTPTLTAPEVAGVCPRGEQVGEAPPAGILPLCWGQFDFAPGSKHVIGGVSPQKDQFGKYWLFSSLSNGGGQNTVYTADSNVATPDTLTVNFVPGALESFVTNPSGLKLNVDGRSNWPSFNFIWGLGETHTVSPLMQQNDSKGRKYIFKSWSNNGPASQNLTVDQAAVTSGNRLIVNYTKLSRLVVQSTPPGLTVNVDGAPCTTPCNVDRQDGAQVEVSASNSIPAGASARMDFKRWSDGASADHKVTINGDATLTAVYTHSYLLSTGSSPAGGVAFKLAPPSADGFYSSNAQVVVTASANPGYQFRKWEGDLSGTFPTGTVTMSTPRSVMAILARVPYLGPAAVKNAAGDTPTGMIAPGSIFSVFGQSLAPQAQVGPSNPLSQSIDGVALITGERILGLMSVSPEQINAQLPSDLPNGNYTLVVQAIGQPDISAPFKVSRNAPGLFADVVDGKSYVVGQHEDGSVITLSSPAKHGEVIAVLGTGFGPYAHPSPDGFMAQAPAPALVDHVIISAGDTRPDTVWAGAAVGYTGVAAVKFKIAPDLPSGTVNLKIQINGQSSNTVLLPVD